MVVMDTLLVWVAVAMATVHAAEIAVEAGGGLTETANEVKKSGKMDVILSNGLARPVDVYWVSNAATEALSVPNLQPGQKTAMNTFAGHAFFFSEVGKGRSAILQTVIMKQGTETYEVTEDSVAASPFREIANADGKGECADRKPFCALNAERGECEVNPGWMIVNCPRSCNACDLLDPAKRCDRARLNVSTEPALQSGGLSSMFARLADAFPELEPNVVSTEPWIVTFDNFMNESETTALIDAVGAEGGGTGFVRSTDTGAYNKFGEAQKVVSQGRTSENAWCRENCDDVPLVRSIIERIEKVTQIPYGNFEQFQVLRYNPGQYYRTHHDFGSSQVKLACGPRILTFFLYLSDVEEGGETNFPRLDIKVAPKRGKALLWPSVMSEDPMKQDPRTFHEALPVVKGLKLAANAWIHMYNFHVPNHWGCTGAFD